MAFPPPPHPNTRPMKGSEPVDPAGDRAFIADWLAHVAAGRIGVKLETPEDIRAITLANERLICGDGRLGIW